MLIVQTDQSASHVYSPPSQPEFDVPDSSADPALDELTGLAAALCGADFACIVLAGDGRLRFKSCFGFEAVSQPHGQTAFHSTLEANAPLLISDTAHDARFAEGGIDLPGAPACLSYAGVALADSGGGAIGVLAVLSAPPGQFSAAHLGVLETLGRMAVTRLELAGRTDAQEETQRARQRSERALAIERSFVSVTLDSIPALVAILDVTGRVVRLNTSCMHLTGLSLAEAVGRPFVEEILDDVDPAWAAARLIEAVSGEISGPHETSWRTFGKHSRRVSWTLRPLTGESGEVQYLIVTGQDITDQIEVEKALQSSETRYRHMVENSLGFLFTCALDGRLTSLNAYTAHTLGYRVEELSGRPIAEFLDPAGAALFRDALRALASGQEWQGTLSLRRSDGSFRHIAFRSRRMSLPDKQPFVLNHGMDITEKHEAEEALRSATRQRELILQSVGDGIYGIDLAGRLCFINEAAAQVLGYTPDQIIGLDVQELLHHGQAGGQRYTRTTSPIFNAMRKREQIRMCGEVFWRKDGTEIPVEYSASPLLEGGQVAGMVVAFQDVTERLRLNRMKDEFVSTVSHELRTPLTSLRASLGLLSSGAFDSKPEKQHQMVEMALGNCERLVRLVNGILDFERLGKGELAVNRMALQAADLLRKASDSAYAAAARARIELRVDAEPVAVFADEKRILQVLNELISNAIKFSPPGTLVKLGARVIGSNQVRFSVEDQGRGIPPDKLDRIFDRFQQGDSSDTRDIGGTGLGLALCRSLVEQHGGRIWAESTDGLGARLFFTLPAAVNSQQ